METPAAAGPDHDPMAAAEASPGGDPPAEGRGEGRGEGGAGHRLDKRRETIRDMFAAVAPRYDLLNRLISGFLDEGWRRRAAAAVDAAPAGPVLDLCAGTGDQARAVGRRGRRVAAADFTVPMLALARGKLARLASEEGVPAPPAPVAADALELPFADRSYAGAVVSFGLRNVADLDRSLEELARVVRPGGRLVVLEAAVPRSRLLRPLYLFYFRRLMPWLGRLLSPRGSAYEYLPASVVEFPDRDAFLRRMAAAGWTEATYTDLTLGAVCLYQGERAPHSHERKSNPDNTTDEKVQR